jgi:hypothetical protein
MKELQEAFDNLTESKRRVEREVLKTLTMEEADREVQEFYRSLSIALATVSVDDIEWLSSEQNCRYQEKFFRARQAKATERGAMELAQVFGQIACQLAIREARARRDERELRRSLSGVRVHWLPPDPNPEHVTVEVPKDAHGLAV